VLFTNNIRGKYVPVKETVRGFKEILEGKYDDLPEQAFYMVGTIDEVVEQARKLTVTDEMAEKKEEKPVAEGETVEGAKKPVVEGGKEEKPK